MTNNYFSLDTCFARLGIYYIDTTITAVTFYPETNSPATSSYEKSVAAEFCRYEADPNYEFKLNINPAGTSFQRSVWQALQKIPSGKPMTYGELAKKLHSHPRAIGQACRRNPIPIIIPCHRVTGQKQSGGYAGDSQGKLFQLKQTLLQHEFSRS